MQEPAGADPLSTSSCPDQGKRTGIALWLFSRLFHAARQDLICHPVCRLPLARASLSDVWAVIVISIAAKHYVLSLQACVWWCQRKAAVPCTSVVE